MKIKTSPLYFGKFGPPRWPPMEGGCELHFCPRRKKGGCGVFIQRIAQPIGLSEPPCEKALP